MKPPRLGPDRTVLAAVLAAVCVASMQLGGCLGGGGSTSEADNPLIIQPRVDGRPVSFSGFAEFYVEGSNPEFLAPHPDDGSIPPRHVPGTEDGLTLIFDGASVLDIPRRDLFSQLLIRNPALYLRKQTRSPLPPSLARSDFNVILFGRDFTTAYMRVIHPDSLGGSFRLPDGSAFDTLQIDLAPGLEYAGTVDTSTEAGTPVALFVPGTPFFAPVRGGGFRFQFVPEGRLPLRWVSSDGRIFDMEDSLGVAWSGPLSPGARIDSVHLPPPVRTLAPPVHAPAGLYTFTDSVRITLSAEPGARIFYTLDNSEPDPSSTLYTDPVVLRSSATLRAVAYLKGSNHSPVTPHNYLLVPAAPSADPAGKAFRDSLVVSLSAARPDASIWYTLDGSNPDTADALVYGAPLVLKASTTLKAAALVPGLGLGRVLEEKYFLVSDSAAAPE